MNEREAARQKRFKMGQIGSSGWRDDVLIEVQRLAPQTGNEFTLQTLYAAAEARLQALHPENDHVRDKIRQQLQVLRDEGFVEFVERGLYRRLR